MGGVGCDNMTIILICFLHGATYAELADRCSQPASLHTGSSHMENRSYLGEEFVSKDAAYPEMAGMGFHEDQLFDKELAPAHNQNFDLRGGVSPGRIKMAEFSHQSTDAAQAQCHNSGHKHQQSCTV